MRGLAGSRAAKVKHLFGLCKNFEEKVRKWRWFLTDVGSLEILNAASANQSVKSPDPLFHPFLNRVSLALEEIAIKTKPVEEPVLTDVDAILSDELREVAYQNRIVASCNIDEGCLLLATERVDGVAFCDVILHDVFAKSITRVAIA